MRARRRLADQELLLRSVPERDFQTSILDACQKLGWTWYHTRDSRRSPEGFPDLVLVKPPRIIFAELKREDGEPSDRQLVWYGLLSECSGVEAHIWRPRDMDVILSVLQGKSAAEATRR